MSNKITPVSVINYQSALCMTGYGGLTSISARFDPEFDDQIGLDAPSVLPVGSSSSRHSISLRENN